jgi:histidine kinase
MEMCLDVTHRKQLEQALEKTEKKYQAIFNNIPNPVFVLNAENFEILDCNQNVEAVYGYTCSEVIGRSFLDLFQRGQKDHYALKLKETLVIDQAKNVTKDGRTIFVSIRISPSDFLGRKILLATTSDITQRLETEQQLIQAGKMATMGEMATGVAHELNQPLSVIQTASSFFLRKISRKEKLDDEVFLKVAKKISSNVERASRIIHHMREFGRKSDGTTEKVHVNDVLRRAMDVMGHQLKARGIRVIWQLEESLPAIIGDASRLEQVIINLLVNARDSVEEKMRSTRGNEDREENIILRTSTGGKMVYIEVADTGIGIPDAIQNRIFEPFFTTKEPGRGTGLGLSISYGIIKDCGGEFDVVSAKGKGATFIIRLPVPVKS